jgi:rubrerythrin
MNDMTAAFLRSAYGGESMAHMRYLIWGEAAAREKFINVARLFRAIAFAEQVHATNHFKALGDVAGAFTVDAGAGFGLGGTSDNLAGAIGGELFEVRQMYPVYMAAAVHQSEEKAEQSFLYALEAEKVHAALYQQAKKAVDGGSDFKMAGPVQICRRCGHTLIGEAPEKCPICNVNRDQFVAFA